ncbi:hypothetical protein BST81_23465 [Leptolyngbya sp. 'hensonii']|uniref:hypothetical protein n=1 Tax=Leptolyngbya sp. 'hensonii' TaxID=1922337 RepID=UPI00094FE6E3|nr:hypothetical protein [Leptolyngbya sp. 'hensonii']OLP16020.1 hypothetical protein BST81_23465 [Leptolyngbya sp. 'hensonii']
MLDHLPLPRQLRQKVDRELQPGEFIRWIEQPIPRFFTLESIGAVLFGIPWTAFALFWMWGAAGFKLPNLSHGLQFQHIFALFGVPFVLIGLGMLSSPLWVWQQAKQTVYLITDNRAILLTGGGSTTIRSYTPEQLGNLFRKERSDGTGDVIFAVREWKDSDGDRRTEDIGFKGIRNPKNVEALLKQLAQKSQ